MKASRRSVLKRLLHSEASGGVVLMASAAIALAVANSAWAPAYFQALETHVGPLSLLHWINDALMALFFLLVGLEIKREMIGGELSTWRRRALPGLAAAGGMAVPALVYLAFAADSAVHARGWAIPAATDIAFALGVLALLGSRAPASLKVFLAALAIMDDLGAVLIIAVFYTSGLAVPMLGGAALCVAALFALNRFKVGALWPYLLLGLPLWYFVHASGVHATIAGVLLAVFIPLEQPNEAGHEHSPLHRLEHALAPWVGFVVTPIFGFANAGVSFEGLTLQSLAHPVTLGVAAGLFFGKQIGVFLASWLAVVLGLASRPPGAGWLQLYGVSLICGVGFTMSLFIGMLAFPPERELMDETKIGVLVGSLASALVGALILLAAKPAAGTRAPTKAIP
ncbi:MAG TPA: Na+/H+ antiporter NhaA [Beijerinckiaceae bacterium]|nr:Na+/H+ antiporter NhaA [Methylobacteriaceae bacterium]HRY05125.1 Na+/H+ antiporter NhaA [Beijerinckiaceae bacterium]